MPKRVTVKNTDTKSFSEYAGKRLREGFFIITLAISLFLVLALATYHNTDPGWSHTGVTEQIANVGGRAGAWFADVFLYIFGYIAYLFPVMVLYNSWLVLREKSNSNGFDYRLFALRGTGFFLVLAGGCALLSLEFAGTPTSLPFTAGGIVGDVVASVLISGFNVFGASLLLVALFLTGITLFSGLSWFTMIEGVGRLSLDAFILLRKLKLILQTRSKMLIASYKARQAKRVEIKRQPIIKSMVKPVPQKQRKVKINPPIEKLEPSLRYEKERQVPLFDAPVEGSVPPLSLLDVPEKASGKGYSNAKLEDMSREVEKKLADFGIEVQVVAVHPGPVITRFELQLAPGLKVSKITALAKDLARSLSVLSVRIVEVIAGKSVVGLEVPNEHREIVRLSEVLASQQYDQARSSLTLALGKDIAGHPVIVDVAKMPHLLVAGTTGSGKSVAINAMLLSILYKATPAEVRLILVDPKMLELAVYDGIPHLLTPVVTDMKEAAGALRWCVAEMERRYRLMASLGVRNLSGFNNKVNAAEKKGEPLLDPLWQPVDGVEHPHLTTLPYILVVIDEFADMMMVVGKKVEQLIARIAQKARAAGIHLILATQRPSVDVITGLIKANVPSRIAFQVSSKVDSRTILDQQGADQLLGHGDMLYLPPGSGVPVRVHGAFVDDHEVHKVVGDLKKRGEPHYIDDITSTQLENNSDAALPGETREEEADPLYDEAVYFVTKARKVSISSVQRRFKIGYNRAARLVEAMESGGVVTPMESNGAREVLASPPPEG